MLELQSKATRKEKEMLSLVIFLTPAFIDSFQRTHFNGVNRQYRKKQNHIESHTLGLGV